MHLFLGQFLVVALKAIFKGESTSFSLKCSIYVEGKHARNRFVCREDVILSGRPDLLQISVKMLTSFSSGGVILRPRLWGINKIVSHTELVVYLQKDLT